MYGRRSSIGMVRVPLIPNVLAGDHPQPERVVGRGPGQPVARSVGRDLAHHDVLVAERRTAEHAQQPLRPAARRCGSWCRGCSSASARSRARR